MRWFLLGLVLLAGCRSSGGGGSRSVIVNAFGGDRVEPGATVIGHSPDGEVIDQTNADAVGRASIGVDDDSLISVVFPGNLGELTPVISVISIPAQGDELSIYGPPRSGTPPLIVGVLQVDGPNLTAATYFDIQIGCATVRVPKLPAALDVGACSMGSDTKLDVLVAGYHDLGGDPPAPQLDGYAAARVTMTNGIATLSIPSWQTTGTTVPVTLDGVTPLVEVELISDGLSFGAQQATDHATLWSGLTVDATRITASLPGVNAARVTTREVTGAPTTIAFAASDFLPPIDVTTALATQTPTTFTWDAAAIGDAVNLHATWSVGSGVLPVVPGPHRVIWDAVLPPDASGVTLPAFGDDLAPAITPQAIVPIDVLVRYVDSDLHEGFAALLAAGVHAEETLQASTVAPRPSDGELRVSHAIGLR
ncbi:MAG TPA: hypothetical protein VIV40_14380 [Kofleriaceae bacterium]